MNIILIRIIYIFQILLVTYYETDSLYYEYFSVVIIIIFISWFYCVNVNDEIDIFMWILFSW